MIFIEGLQRYHRSKLEFEKDFCQITYQDIASLAMQIGECDSVREVLRKKVKLGAKLEAMFRTMQAVQRKVRGSEAEKGQLRARLTSVRIWIGICLFLCLIS